MNNNREHNLHIRVNYIENKIDERNFKRLLHMRYKKINFHKYIIPIILNTYEIAEILLWNIYDYFIGSIFI